MWRRRKDNLKRRMMSGILACLLVATSLTNTVGIITSFAGQTANIPRVSYKYDDLKNDKGQLDKMVQINVQAENESFAPGSEMVLKVYVQNLSDQNLTGGSLKWSGKGLEEAGFLDEEEEDLFNGPGWDGEDNDSDTSDLMEELGNFSVTGLRKSVALKADDTAAKDETEAPEQNVEIITDVETEEEEDDTSDPQTDEEGKRIRGIELAPGEVYETRFYGTVEDMDSIVTRKVTFEFLAGTDDNTVAQDKAEFTYNTGMALVQPIEFDDGPALMTNELNTMYIHTRFEDEKILDEYTWEITDEDEATPSDAERHEITVATMSNGTEDSSEGTTPANMKYSIVTYGAKLEGIEAWYDDERSGWGEMTTGVSFRVKDDTEPGVYFGQVTTSIRREGKSYKTTQGFHFFVLGDGQLVLKGNINGAEIQVKGDRSSFPEGDMLSLKVTEVPAEKMDLVQEAMAQKAEELGVSVDKMKAMDIKVIADGVEQELEGEVEVTFSNLTLEKVEETIGLEGEEDTEDGEVEELEEVNTNVVFGLRKAGAGTEEEQADAAGEAEIAEAENESEGEEKEESTLAVWHLDEDAGIMNEMDSEVNDDGDVVMATEHFSIYVVVDMGQLGGSVNLTVEHWGTVETIDGNGTDATRLLYSARKLDVQSQGQQIGYYTKDEVFDRVNIGITSINVTGKIYETDQIVIPNKKRYETIEELSKICRVMPNDRKNYIIKEIWVSSQLDNADKNTWVDYTKYNVTTNSNGDITNVTNSSGGTVLGIELKKDSIIRFVYEERKIEKLQYRPVTFYDHNVSDNGSTEGTGGTNTQTNFKNYNVSSRPNRIGAGQFSSGNKNEWAFNQGHLDNNPNISDKRARTSDGFLLNEGNYYINESVDFFDSEGKYTHTGTVEKVNQAKVVPNIVQETLDENYNLKYGSKIADPGFFSAGRTGTVLFENYKLGFEQKGDTYRLSAVKRDSDSDDVLSNLTNIRYTGTSWSSKSALYSNCFWPLDRENYAGMDAKGTSGDGDGGGTHNFHFGMRFDFTFRVGDYVGPMNFYFRGDDDFWMFVDGKRVIDLGGIHSAEGQAINLKEWLESPAGGGKNGQLDKDKVHRVSVFYMERGGFGSCCYMQFTLPNCEPIQSPSNPQTTVTVKKDWDDYNNPFRPESVDVTLYQVCSTEGEMDRGTKTLSDENNWQYTWTQLSTTCPNHGTPCTYTVKENKVAGYDGQTITQSGENDEGWVIVIKNTLSPEVKVKVTKEWEDGNNTCHNRPQELKFQLYADGEIYPSEQGVLVIDGSQQTGNTWVGTFEHLPKYRYVIENGKKKAKEIVYTVRETDGNRVIESDENGNGVRPLPGENQGESYKVFYEDDQPLTLAETNNNYVAHTKVTNTHKHQLEVEKIWSEGNAAKINADREKALPYVGLYEITTSADGKKAYSPVDGKYQRMTENNSKITAVFTELDPAKQYTAKELIEVKLNEGETVVTDYDFVIPVAGRNTYFKGVEEGGFYQECYQVKYEGPANKDNHSYPCIQAVTIRNELRMAKLRVAKWITNWNEALDVNDLPDDEFIIQVKKQISTDENVPDAFKVPFETGVVLKHAGTENGSVDSGKISGYIEVLVKEGGDTFDVSEIIPKEYQKLGIRYIAKYTSGQSIADAAGLSGDTVTVKPGDDGLIVVYNRFDHEDYFHHDASVTNFFKENGAGTRTTGVEPVSLAAFIPMPEDKEKKEKLEQLEENSRLM